MRHLFTHTAEVRRQTQTIGGNGQPTHSLTVITLTLPCLVEGLKGSAKSSLLGRIEGASYTISWTSPELKDGDLVTWNGKQFALREILDDTTRPRLKYYNAILQERNR